MSIDESTAKGLTTRFQREAANGWSRFRSKVNALPLSTRPRSQIKLSESLIKAAGPAVAYDASSKKGMSAGLWKFFNIPNAGRGFMLSHFAWPMGDSLRLLDTTPCFVTPHAVQRVAQCYLDNADQISELGESIALAMLPVGHIHRMELQCKDEGVSLLSKSWGDCWAVSPFGCVLMSHNKHGARIAKTFIAREKWDEWRSRKWGRYLDSDENTLIADCKTGDVLNVLNKGAASDGATVARDVAKFNLRKRGIASWSSSSVH